MRGGGGGSGSGGGGGGGDAALLRRLRTLLFGGGTGNDGDGGARNARGGRAASARGGGGGGGRPTGRATGDRARSAAAAGGQQTGAADWTCGHCGFAPNFSRRRFCFDCGRARLGGPASPPARAPTHDGPVGAGGSKPQLAWGARGTGRREVDEAPTRRTPGASVASLVEEARRNAACSASADVGRGIGASGHAQSLSVGAAAAVGADGFITVGKRGKPVAAAPTHASSAGEARDAGNRSGGTRPADAASAEARGGAVVQDVQRDDQEAEEDDAPSQGPDELRRRWAEEVAVVKRLAKQGLPEGHPAMAAAVAARDAAEAAWRGAKPPALVATRLKWAQSKLTRALELAEATRAAIAKAEDEHGRLMAELHDRRCEDEQRVHKRRRAVEELQAEIGGGLPAARAGDGGAAAVLAACGSLCNAVGPELLALVERLPDGSEEWQAANKVLATLAASQRRMEEAAGMHDDRDQPEAFDIGDAEDDDIDAMSEASQWSESHELRDQGEAGGAAVNNGQASRLDGSADGTADTGIPPGGDEWINWGQAQWHTPHWQTDQHGRWRRASWVDHWEAEHMPTDGWSAGQQSGTAHNTRRGGCERDDEACEPSAKHRRQQASERAATPQGAAVSASGSSDAAERTRTPTTNSATGIPPAGHDGAAAFERQVADIVNRAISQGVQPITAEGEELITLSPELLSRWVAEHLETSAGR